MDNHIRISLNETERLFAFPYPLDAIGYYPGGTEADSSLRGKDSVFYFRDEYQFSLRLTGNVEKIRNNINGEEYINTFPHVILKCPGHRYYNDYLYSPNSICIHYNKTLFQPFFDAHFSSGPLVWDFELTPQITAIVHEMTEKLRISQNYSIADKLDLLAFQLLEELILFRINTGKQKLHNDSRQRIQNIASYIKMNYNTTIDLNELLAANHISRATFFRHWNAVYDKSPQIYQMNLRMQEAERLLLETGNTIQSIAEQIGFSSSAYFCAIFKREKGCSPAEYARRITRKMNE